MLMAGDASSKLQTPGASCHAYFLLTYSLAQFTRARQSVSGVFSHLSCTSTGLSRFGEMGLKSYCRHSHSPLPQVAEKASDVLCHPCKYTSVGGNASIELLQSSFFLHLACRVQKDLFCADRINSPLTHNSKAQILTIYEKKHDSQLPH